ncbi:hypothetical protein HZC09_05920 [Candidatus Micrarchaeota archaeon]|nr:hypothetical protein [Candidatus Micrarchaeota archaeon]
MDPKQLASMMKQMGMVAFSSWEEDAGKAKGFAARSQSKALRRNAACRKEEPSSARIEVCLI